jgi:hypothetical protein
MKYRKNYRKYVKLCAERGQKPGFKRSELKAIEAGDPIYTIEGKKPTAANIAAYIVSQNKRWKKERQ